MDNNGGRKFLAVRRVLALEIVSVWLLYEGYLLYLMGKEYDITRVAAGAVAAYGLYFVKRYLDEKNGDDK